ncbi:MAG: phosphoglycolate phosphatase [Zestosphaera tikiterensis]|uniref:Phosphoglycolate phosphatase n=1 Tax=Zestosphaera tikiterensis TaxID=1973259 RepID=A0A2R7Y6S9_9CREN|nr:MAG: phosphoglycolate phosphatase [Zestosphaera tikiterensis]
MLNKLLLFVDVDGTLTIDRKTSAIDPEVINVLRELTLAGVEVVLISGNSLPVLRGLSLYLGLSGKVIAENGAVIYVDKPKVVCEGCEDCDVVYRSLLNYKDIFKDAWQNMFRFCEKALEWVGDEEEAEAIAKQLVRELNLNTVEITSSGYALHIHPRNCNKGRGIAEFIKETSSEGLKTICVGDSDVDIPMKNVCSLLVAVGNSDPDLLKVADVITKNPSSKGFIEIAMEILKNLRDQY